MSTFEISNISTLFTEVASRFALGKVWFILSRWKIESPCSFSQWCSRCSLGYIYKVAHLSFTDMNILVFAILYHLQTHVPFHLKKELHKKRKTWLNMTSISSNFISSKFSSVNLYIFTNSLLQLFPQLISGPQGHATNILMLTSSGQIVYFNWKKYRFTILPYLNNRW